MKRANIKNATIGIMAVVVVLFAAINIIYECKRVKSEKSSVYAHKTTGWSDTVTSTLTTTDELRKMDNEVARFMSRWDLKGMQISVMRHDSLLYTRGFGYADRESRSLMQANTIMRIASSSKLITAVAIMKLIEEGKLNLTDTVFGPHGILNNKEYTQAVSDKRHFKITIGDLLKHKGGFTLGAGDPMFNTAEIIKAKKLKGAPNNEELVEIVLRRRLGFQPGSGYRYSNFGYMLLSLIIERVSGESYWDYANKNVLEPAGITGMRPATNYLAEKYPNEARYYSPDSVKVEEFTGSGRMVDRCYGGTNINGLMGAGGWLSSSADLARLVAAIDGDPRFKDIISHENVKLMTIPDRTSADSDTEPDGDLLSHHLCLGWSNVKKEGHWKRSGTLSSAHSLIDRFPDGECWVVTTNSGVWRGFRFTRDMENLVERLRTKYSNALPRQNLFLN